MPNLLTSADLPANIIKCLPPEERRRLGLPEIQKPTARAATTLAEVRTVVARRPRLQQPEQAIQRAVMVWWSVRWRQLKVPDERVLMHIANQGIAAKAGGKVRGGLLKSLGVRAGVPDLFLAMQRAGVPFSATDPAVPGLWIELKAGKKGQVSEDQLTMQAALRMAGYEVVVCRSSGAAIETIERYLQG